MNGNSEEYIQAYTEVNCLLEHFPNELIEKLPKNILNMIKNKSDEKYVIQIDTNKKIQDNNISKKTKDILTVLKYNFWSNEEEKEKLKKIFYENEAREQEELSKKYDIDKAFNDQKIKTEEVEENKNEVIEETINENAMLIEHKESFISKIINKIKNIFKRFNNR